MGSEIQCETRQVSWELAKFSREQWRFMDD